MRNIREKSGSVYLRTLVLDRINDPEEGIEGFVLYFEHRNDSEAHFLSRKAGDVFLLSANLAPSTSFGMDFAEVSAEQEEMYPNTVDKTLYLVARRESDIYIEKLNKRHKTHLTILDDRTDYNL